MSRPDIPASYAALPWQHISVAHHPPEATAPTNVVIVNINRPEKHNAFTPQMEIELVRIFEMLNWDDRVRVIIVTGTGKMFCTGADLDIGLHREPNVRAKDHRDGGGRVALAIHRCRKPTIAAIQGSAVGVGITMTLPMTIRIASATAKIGFVFARRGVVMEACSSFFLPKLIGLSRALYLTTTGSVFPATSPHLNGLFAEILQTPGEVLPRATELASQIALNTSTVSTYLMREMMWRNPGSAEETHLLDSEIMFQLYDKKDKEEGISSFLEKRPANFPIDFENGMPDGAPWWKPVDVIPKRNGRHKSRL